MNIVNRTAINTLLGLIVAVIAGVTGSTARATTISIEATLVNQPSQFNFPATFPFAETITGTFTFADPASGSPPYDVGGAAGVGEDEIAGSTISVFRGISSFTLNFPTYGTVTGTGGQVSALNLATETFRIAAGGTINDAGFFGGTVSGPTVPLTVGTATLVGAFLEVQSSNNLLSSQNVTDAANALINNLAGWDVRTDKQIRLSFSNSNAPTQTIEVDYQLTSVQLVPIPAAVWLFGSALGLLGWMRRRTI